MKYVITYLMLTCALSSAQNLIWSEEFNYTSAPDSDVWSYDLGAGGWGNAELQRYTNDSSNVWVNGSNLVITAVRQGDSFTSARIKTLNKLTFKYGVVEARIQTPDLANGLWPAFWTLGNDFPVVGWPACGEIDVMEMGQTNAISAGRVNRRVGSTAHWESGGGYATYGLYKDMPADINDTFVIYRMVWTPFSISTFINDQEIWTMDISQGAGADLEEFHKPHFFLLNLAVGGTYTGSFGPDSVNADFPAEYKVDYIRVYDIGDTVLGGSSTVVPGANLLANPGFESGVSGWTMNLSGGAASDSTSYARTGTDSLVIDSAGAGDWSSPNASQTFSASAGDVFNIQGYMLNPAGSSISGASFGLFKIEFRDSGGNVLEPASVDVGTVAPAEFPGAESRPFLSVGSATDTWIFSEAQAEAPANTAWVSFILLNVNQPGNPGPMYFDDIQARLFGDPVPPFSLSAAMVGGEMRISFPTQNGASYRVGYKTNLTDAAWAIIETIIGDGTTNSASYPANDPVRFYRVLTP